MSTFPRDLAFVESGEIDERIKKAWELAKTCRLCPRECRVNRIEGEKGTCQAGNVLRISSFIRHRGEEPVLSGWDGSGTVFFSHCSLRCRFCQNYQLSLEGEGRDTSIQDFAKGMLGLKKAGVHNINWVTPSHYLPWLLEGLKLAAQDGLNIPLVYNCGGYESLEAIKLLDGIVDIYLPDAKYADSELAKKLSGAPDYPEVNRVALAEMWRRVGELETEREEGDEGEEGEEGVARKGLIVRHLVIPNETRNTLSVLDMLKETVGVKVAISLMGQYFPTYRTRNTPPYNRSLRISEYQEVAQYMFDLGFEAGWVQDGLGVALRHRPDFREKKEEMY
jgi:putative pyruvate formate lyase activating enzyme